MADEITATGQLAFVKGGTTVTLPEGSTPFGVKIDVAAARFIRMRQNVGLTWEVLDLGDIATGGWFCAINHDATNFVQIRPVAADAAMVRLNPGEFCLFRMDAAATAPQAQADTAAVDLEYMLVEA